MWEGIQTNDIIFSGVCFQSSFFFFLNILTTNILYCIKEFQASCYNQVSITVKHFLLLALPMPVNPLYAMFCLFFFFFFAVYTYSKDNTEILGSAVMFQLAICLLF